MQIGATQLGGEDGFSLTNDHSFDINITATSEYLSSHDDDPTDDDDTVDTVLRDETDQPD